MRISLSRQTSLGYSSGELGGDEQIARVARDHQILSFAYTACGAAVGFAPDPPRKPVPAP